MSGAGSERGAKLGQQGEVVFQVPGLDDAASLKAVKVEGPVLDGAAGGGDAEQLPAVRATADRAHRDLVASDHHVLVGDSEVGEHGAQEGDGPAKGLRSRASPGR